jgi:hypothetical protein
MCAWLAGLPKRKHKARASASNRARVLFLWGARRTACHQFVSRANHGATGTPGENPPVTESGTVPGDRDVEFPQRPAGN